MRIVFILISVFFFLQLNGQRNLKEEVIGTPMIGLHYTSIFPQLDLADRYGYMNQIGTTFGYKTKQNYVYGIEGNFNFGNQIKIDNLLTHLEDSFGNITEVGGSPAIVDLLLRGFNINAHVGKIIPWFGPNPNSGLYISFGAGYTLHRIRIETTHDVVPLIETENKRGYDRQTVGLSLHQFIGYSHLSNKNSIHFYLGFYANQGFTKFSRSYFYDTGLPSDPSIQNDFQLGIRGGWYVPVYKRKAKTVYFN
jgi:hypothetical protein